MVAVMMITRQDGFYVLVVEIVAMAVPVVVVDKRELNDHYMVSGCVPKPFNGKNITASMRRIVKQFLKGTTPPT